MKFEKSEEKRAVKDERGVAGQICTTAVRKGWEWGLET